jgi:DNA ligase-1
MTFKQLYTYSQRIRNESSRNGKITIICEYLSEVSADEAVFSVHYIAGRLPQGRMNLAWQGLSDLLHATRAKKRTPLQLVSLHAALDQVSRARGKRKYEILKPVFQVLDKVQREYLLSLVFGEAQQGAGEGVVKKALGRMFDLSDAEIDEAYLRNPDIGRLFLLFKEKGRKAVREIMIQLFRPVKPMLAQVSRSIDEVLKDLQDAVIEYKLDGIRIQVHRDNDDVRIYSRNLKERTIHFPELVAMIKELPASRFIMDGEAIALDKKGRIVPFQVLAKRTTRKKDIEQVMQGIPVIPQFFDILYIDHEDLTSMPYDKRYAVLRDILPETGFYPPRTKIHDARRAQQFFQQAVNAGNEGVVIKGMHSPYHPGTRGKHWFKIKRTYTIDCVILAAEWGYGRRKGRLSNIHLGVLDETRTKYLMVGKTFKGLTDRMLQWMTDTLPLYKVHEDRWTVYVKPVIVVEIEFNEVQTSPRYDSKMSLRFARVRQFRKDKDAGDVNTILDLERIASAQRPASRGVRTVSPYT